MKNYELTYLISPDLSEEETKQFQEKVNSLIQTEGGQVSEVNLPIKKGLSSAKKDRGETYLISLSFQLNPEKVTLLEKKLKKEGDILRYLILSKPSAKPAIAFRKRVSGRKPAISGKKSGEGKVELKEIDEKLKEIIGE